MKKIVCLILSAILMLCFTGCGKDEGEITLVLDWTPNVNHLGFYVAQKMGFYEDCGLKVDIVQPPENGAEMMVASGKAEFGVSFQDSLAPCLSLEEPMDLVAVAALCQSNLSGIISAKDKGIDSFKKLEGKTYSTWGSPIEQAIIGYAMEKDGGDVEKLDMINSTVTDVLGVLETNVVDTMWVYEYCEVIEAELYDKEYNYLDFRSVDEVLDYYTPVLVTSNKYLSENSEEARKFVEATKKGYEYAASHPEEAAKILMESTDGLDERIVVEGAKFISDYYLDENGEWGTIEKERWDGFFKWLFEKGLVERDLTGTGFTKKYLK